MNKYPFSSLALGLTLLSLNQGALAGNLFSANIIIDNQQIPYQTYDNVLDLAEQYSSKGLKSIYNDYTSNSSVEAQVQYMGLKDISLSYQRDSRTLNLSIPSANINQNFKGNSRGESSKLLIAYLKNMPKALNEKIVESSAFHPVNTMRADSAVAITNSGSFAMEAMDSLHFENNMETDSETMLAFAPRFGRYTQEGVDTNVINLPLMYSRWLPDQQYNVVVDIPVTISKTDDALAGQGSIGVGINSKVTQDWYLMPQLRVGTLLSQDIGASAAVYSTSVTSNYRFYPGSKATLRLINMFAIYKTATLRVGDFKGSYDLTNYLFRNGLEYSQRLDTVVFGQPLILKANLTRTDYSGDAVYSKYSHDASFSIGIKNPNKRGWIKDYRIGASFSQSQHDIKGFNINAGYTF